MKFIRLVVFVMFSFVLAGCIHFSYRPSTYLLPSVKQYERTAIENMYAQADKYRSEAKDKESLQNLINVYEKILERDSHQLPALRNLGHLYLLMGDAYSRKKKEKQKNFTKALEHNEQFMLISNKDFRKLVTEGKDLWEALGVLTVDEMDAMYFWSTAIFYNYKESLGFLGQVFNYRWIKRAKLVLARMTEINPDWGDGMLHFSWGCYYLSIPEFIGGDRILAQKYFNEAVAKGPNKLFLRWGRAKYFYFKTGNVRLEQNEMQWVRDQDITAYDDPKPWKIYFQNDANRLLENKSRY